MPHDVFVSHSKDDRLTAYALCNKLESAGVRCWIGPRDVEPGVDWGAAIINAISGCRVMVLIFSLKANSSRHVHREVQRAFDKDLTVIPFRVEDVEPTGTLEYYLSSVHWLDAMTPPLEEHLEAVVRRVKALLLPPSVLESATRLAAENTPTLPQTVSRPRAAKLRSPPVAPEPQIHAPADPPISPPPLPPQPPAPVATKKSPVPLEQLVRNIGSRVPSDLLVRREELLISIGLITALNVVLAAIAKSGIAPDFAPILLLALVPAQMYIFFRLGRKTEVNRWLRLAVVVIGAALALALIMTFLGLGGIKAFKLAVVTCASMGAGGALSVYVKRLGGEQRAPLHTIVAGITLVIIVYVVLGLLVSILDHLQPSPRRRDPRFRPAQEEQD
jgi:hypothetical protein